MYQRLIQKEVSSKKLNVLSVSFFRPGWSIWIIDFCRLFPHFLVISFLFFSNVHVFSVLDINRSLSFLEQVVLALSNPSRDHVPYRQSKLTYLLKDSLGGNCKTLMVANVWCEHEQLEETISTLKFATRMMRVSNDAVVNVHTDPDVLLRQYEKEIRELKQELTMHDQLANRSNVSYEPFTEDQKTALRETARDYLEERTQELEVLCFSFFAYFFSPGG